MTAALCEGPCRTIGPGDDLNFSRAELCTSLNAARVFLQYAGPSFRWVPEIGWLCYDGVRWVKDAEGRLTQTAQMVGDWYRTLAADFAQDRQDPTLIKWLLQFARYCDTTRGQTDFIEQAKPYLYAPISDFDRWPYLVNFQNCVIDFEHIDGDLPRIRPHCDSDYLTQVIPHDYSINAAAPVWQRFLSEALPDPEVRSFYQRFQGYGILGTPKEQVFAIIYGPEASGKSTAQNAVLHAIGPHYGMQADSRMLLVQRTEGPRNDLAALRGVRFLACVETPEGARLDENLLKQLVGGDRIRARYLYQESFEFTPQCTPWISTNHRPVIKETSGAIWRRLRLIGFEHIVPPERRDPNLPAKLEREAEGILRWIVDGTLAYLRDGLNAPASVLAACDDYRHAEDNFAEFFDTRIKIMPGFKIPKNEVYRAYRSWCEDNSDNPASQRRLSAYLEERGIRGVWGHCKRRLYEGIVLNHPEVEG